MRKLVVGIAAAAALLAAIAVWPQRGPMNHGWDWPWHDWWHAGWQHGQLPQDAPGYRNTTAAGQTSDYSLLDQPSVTITQRLSRSTRSLVSETKWSRLRI